MNLEKTRKPNIFKCRDVMFYFNEKLGLHISKYNRVLESISNCSIFFSHLFLLR